MARIGFVGDVYPGPLPGLAVGGDVRELVGECDLLVANLEGPVTAVEAPAVAKGAHLRTAPSEADILRQMGVGVVSLANNHMFDFGAPGFEETLEYLKAAGIASVGAGSDLESARSPLIVDVEGMRIGFLAYSAAEIETVVATVASPGCAPLDPAHIEADIGRLNGSVDAVVVLLHWVFTGHEMPSPLHHALGPALIEAGATLVVGSHPHVAQGLLAHGNGLVAYSLGDFAFYPATASGRAVHQYRARQTGMFVVADLEPGRVVGHEVNLTRQRGISVEMERSRLRTRAVARSSRRVSRDGVSYQRSWKWYIVGRTLQRLAPWKWKTIRPGTVKGFGVALRQIFKRN